MREEISRRYVVNNLHSVVYFCSNKRTKHHLSLLDDPYFLALFRTFAVRDPLTYLLCDIRRVLYVNQHFRFHVTKIN